MPGQTPDPGTGGTTGRAALPTPPGNAFFFDDFEAGAPGTKPAAWATWIDYILTAANTPTSAEFALLDNTEKHSGNQSVHFHATGATEPAMLTMPLPANTSRLFLRVFLKSSTPLGARPKDTVSNHETLLGLRGTPGDGNFEIRFGEAKGALGYNMVGPDRSDAVSPPMAQWGQGPSMSANEWHCIELDFINDDPANPQAHASVDGSLVRSITQLSDWHVPLSGAGTQWLNGMFKEVILGWQSFSNPPANDVWMDDIVLSNSQIGCN
jgi:hypothetical protein